MNLQEELTCHFMFDIRNIIIGFVDPLEFLLIDRSGELNELELINFGQGKVALLDFLKRTQDTLYEEVCCWMNQIKNDRILAHLEVLLEEEEDFFKRFLDSFRHGSFEYVKENFLYSLIKILARKIYFGLKNHAFSRKFFHLLLCRLSLYYSLEMKKKKYSQVVDKYFNLDFMNS